MISEERSRGLTFVGGGYSVGRSRIQPLIPNGVLALYDKAVTDGKDIITFVIIRDDPMARLVS